MITSDTLFRTVDDTWPAAAFRPVGPWLVRSGLGGGQRVSAATATGPGAETQIELAESAMHELGQRPLFMIRPGETALDEALEARGYRRNDPVVAYAAPVDRLANPAPDPMAAFVHWPPLAIARDLWAEAGIGPARLAVMERAQGSKCALLGRIDDRAAGVAFVALSGEVAMLHALEVAPQLRRRGVAGSLIRAGAAWAGSVGATTFSLVVTEANLGARTLYAALGMDVVGHYHYRVM